MYNGSGFDVSINMYALKVPLYIESRLNFSYKATLSSTKDSYNIFCGIDNICVYRVEGSVYIVFTDVW